MTCPFCDRSPETPVKSASPIPAPLVGSLYLCAHCCGLSTVSLNPINTPVTIHEFTLLDPATKADIKFAIRDILSHGRLRPPTKIDLTDWITLATE